MVCVDRRLGCRVVHGQNRLELNAQHVLLMMTKFVTRGLSAMNVLHVMQRKRGIAGKAACIVISEAVRQPQGSCYNLP